MEAISGLIFLEGVVKIIRNIFHHKEQAQTGAENWGERIGEFRFVRTQTEAEFVRIRHSGQAQTESDNWRERIGEFRFVRTQTEAEEQSYIQMCRKK